MITDQQKEQLADHVAFHKPIPKIDGDNYFLIDGEVIEFTGFEYYSRNVRFTINNDRYSKMWYSQFTDFFISSDLMIYSSFIAFKDSEPIKIRDIEMADFCKRVKNKKFKVEIDDRACFVFNKKSNIWDVQSLITYKDAHDYIKKCINDNQVSKIGDLLKTANYYHLTEV